MTLVEKYRDYDIHTDGQWFYVRFDGSVKGYEFLMDAKQALDEWLDT